MKKVVFYLFFNLIAFLVAAQPGKGRVQILYTPGKSANSFIPEKNIGGAVDGHEKGDIDRMLTLANLQAMHTVGLKPVSYRTRTELAGEVWHWNPIGTWSDPGKQQGYWVSDSNSSGAIQVSNGYRLPRRGNTIDQANNDGYSRIDDGNHTTFWKSNPYLDEYYTKESNKVHPQWVVVDLGGLKDVNTIRIIWGKPFAVSYTVDYALDIGEEYFEPFQPDFWHSFPTSFFNNSKRDNDINRLSAKPIKVRFVRISMTESSYTATTNSNDIRDQLGFAINELEVGYIDSKGKFHDSVHHAPNHTNQSIIYVSSTDPWHTQQDVDRNVEQAGIDRFFTSGLTEGQPALIPAGLLYDTPENVLNMVKYIRSKGYSMEELEMGEEPEGQLISPVDYAALYYQWATQVKEIEPAMRMGGPGFATLAPTVEDEYSFTEAKWTNAFLDYLKKHNAVNLFSFFSFEWYPFDDICAPTAPQLAAAPGMLSIALNNIRDVLPANTPIYLTEYGYSAFSGRPEVEIEGALMYADILGKFMALGGSKSFLYGYEPAYLEHTDNCDYGNNILFGLGSTGEIKFKTAAFNGMQMLTHYWAQPADSILELYPGTTNLKNKQKQALITAYALRGKSGKWSLMLINKDPNKPCKVDVEIRNAISKQAMPFDPSRLIQYSKQQYHWVNSGSKSYPSLNLPPEVKKIKWAGNVSLPPYSITILN